MKFEELILSSLKSSISFTTMFFKVTFTKYKNFHFIIQQNTSPNHEGTHWVRIEQEKDSKIIFKQVSFFNFILTMQRIVFQIIINIGEVDRIQHFCKLMLRLIEFYIFRLNALWTRCGEWTKTTQSGSRTSPASTNILIVSEIFSVHYDDTIEPRSQELQNS